MIELTTGVVFLMSSLYGAGQHAAVASPATPMVSTTTEQTQTIETSPLNNANAMQAYLRKEYKDTPILVEIARCESDFRQFGKDGTIIRGRVNSGDVGVMQINERYHADTAVKLNMDLYTVEGNVAYAKYLYGKYGTDPWSASSKCWNSDLARVN